MLENKPIPPLPKGEGQEFILGLEKTLSICNAKVSLGSTSNS